MTRSLRSNNSMLKNEYTQPSGGVYVCVYVGGVSCERLFLVSSANDQIRPFFILSSVGKCSRFLLNSIEQSSKYAAGRREHAPPFCPVLPIVSVRPLYFCVLSDPSPVRNLSAQCDCTIITPVVGTIEMMVILGPHKWKSLHSLRQKKHRRIFANGFHTKNERIVPWSL